MAGIFSISHLNIDERRRRRLVQNAYVVRQQSIRRGDDFEGWRLARLMRDAATLFQMTTAERKYLRWLQADALRGRAVA
jgi:hypothetical protein